MRIDNFPDDALERSVGAFCEPIGLRVVGHAASMNYRKVLCEASNKLINEVLNTLITEDFYGAAEPTPDVLVQEFLRIAGRVVP